MSKLFGTLLVVAAGLAGQELTVRGGDGSIYRAFQYSPREVAVEKRSADDLRSLWVRVEPEHTVRSLKVTPNGGVALATLSNTDDATLFAWDGVGTRYVAKHFKMESPAMTVDAKGDFLIAGRGLELRRWSAIGQELQRTSPLSSGARLVAGIEIGLDGDLFVAGSSDSASLSATPGAYQQASRSGTCIAGFRIPYAYPCFTGWVAQLDAARLELRDLTFLGGTGESQLTGLAVARNGEPMVSGWVTIRQPDSEVYPVTDGVVRPNAAAARESMAMTVSRLSRRLDRLVASTWFTGSDRSRGDRASVDANGDVVVVGRTTSPNFPDAGGFSLACGARRGLNGLAWTFGLKMAEDLSRVLAVTHAGEAQGPARIEFNTRTPCLFNSASHEHGVEVARGQIMTLIGGPFAADEKVRVGGVIAEELYRSETQINFVVPRSLTAGESAVLEIGAERVRALDVVEARPRWFWKVFDDGAFRSRGSFLIDARRPDGTLNTDQNGFAPGEEIRAYATGVDLSKPLRAFTAYDGEEIPVLGAQCVEGTFCSVVEIRVPDPVSVRGAAGLFLRNGETQTPLNPGYVWIGARVE